MIFRNFRIAAATETGNIKGLKEGSTLLTVEYKGFTASVNVDVRQSYSEQEDLNTNKTTIITKKLP